MTFRSGYKLVWMIALPLLLVMLNIGVGQSSAQPAAFERRPMPVPSNSAGRITPEMEARIIAHAKAEIGQLAIEYNGKYYTSFEYLPGFVPQPRPGTRPIVAGIAEMSSSSDWSAVPRNAIRQPSLLAEVSWRVHLVRFIDAKSGATNSQSPIHVWKWYVHENQGQLSFDAELIDPRFQGRNHVHRLIAELRNLPPEGVVLTKPSLVQVQEALRAIPTSKRGPACGFGEVWNPTTGNCTKTRDPYYKGTPDGTPNRGRFGPQE